MLNEETFAFLFILLVAGGALLIEGGKRLLRHYEKRVHWQLLYDKDMPSLVELKRRVDLIARLCIGDFVTLREGRLARLEEISAVEDIDRRYTFRLGAAYRFSTIEIRASVLLTIIENSVSEDAPEAGPLRYQYLSFAATQEKTGDCAAVSA